MNLEELIDETRERLGETTEADFFTDAEITRALNEGLRRFSNEERWPWLYTEYSTNLTEDVDYFDLPDDIAINRIFGFNIEDDETLAGGVMLERVQPMEGFRLKHAYKNYTGVPRWYYISHTNLDTDLEPPLRYTAKVIPTPDSDYEVTGLYLMVPTLLDSDEQEPAMPTEYQTALPAYAAGVLFLKELQISQKAGEQFQLYNAILANAIKETKQFDADEVVAWGRSKPSGRKGYGFEPWNNDIRSRILPTLGG